MGIPVFPFFIFSRIKKERQYSNMLAQLGACVTGPLHFENDTIYMPCGKADVVITK